MLLGLALLAFAAAAEPITIEPTLAVQTSPAPPGSVSWSPDGKWLATRLETVSGTGVWGFARTTVTLPTTLTMAGPPNANAAAGDVATQWRIGDASWGSGAVLVFAGAAPGGGWTLWAQSPLGAAPSALLADLPGTLTSPTVPVDPVRAVAFVRAVGTESDIWMWARGSPRAVPMTADTGAERYPAFRADGAALAFVREDMDQVPAIVIADVEIIVQPDDSWRFVDFSERAEVKRARAVGRPVWVGDTPVWFAEADDGTWHIARLDADGSVALVATGVRGGADAAPGVHGDWMAWASPDGTLLYAGTPTRGAVVEIHLGLEAMSEPALGVRRDGDVWGAISAKNGEGRGVYLFDLTTVLSRQVAQP